MRRMWLGLSVVAGVVLGTGCGTSPEDAEARLAALEAEGKQMDEALDTVEERLLGSQSMLAMWQEMGRRHQQVSAIQCKVADEHLVAIMKHYDKQEEKARKIRTRRGSGDSVAAVDSTVLTSGKAKVPQRSSN